MDAPWQRPDRYAWERVERSPWEAAECHDLPEFRAWALGDGRVAYGPDGLIFIRMSGESPDRPAFCLDYFAYAAYDPLDDVGVWITPLMPDEVSA